MKTNAKGIVAAAIAAALTAGAVAGSALASPTTPFYTVDQYGLPHAMPWHEKDGMAARTPVPAGEKPSDICARSAFTDTAKGPEEGLGCLL